MSECSQCEKIPPIGELGKMLYHFTTLDAAVKIIASRKLRFSKLEDMNDIAESSLTIFSMHHSNTEIEQKRHKYKVLSFSIDNDNLSAYEINSMWGYYGESGNGVCLVFDKYKLISQLKQSYNDCEAQEITYIQNHTNTCFLSGKKNISSEQELWDNRIELFFTKSTDWKHEQEFRFIIKGEQQIIESLAFNDSLVAVIVCAPKFAGEEVKNSTPYKVMCQLANHPPLLCYQQNLGNKELYCYECTEPHVVAPKLRLSI